MPAPSLPDPARGVFETLLVAGAAPVELDAHLARLHASLDVLYGAPLPAEAERLVVEHASGLDLGRLRLTAIPTPQGPPRIEIATAAIDPAIVCPPWERGIELRTRSVAGWNGGHKWVDRQLLESLEAELSPATPLLADEDGALLETTRANLFVVDPDGVVATPPTDGRILPGVARMRAIEAARAAGMDVVEKVIGRDDVALAREAFLTGSIRCVEPIRSFDGAPVGEASRPSTETIAAKLSRLWLDDRQPR